MVSISKIEKGLAAYLDTEIMPKLSLNGLEKVMAGTALSLFIKRSGKMLEYFKTDRRFLMLGLVENEEFDVDILAETVKENLPSGGVKIDIPMIGNMTFHKTDVDKLHEYITKL